MKEADPLSKPSPKHRVDTKPSKSTERETLRKRLLQMIVRNEALRRPKPR
jgi:hypothetical protein